MCLYSNYEQYQKNLLLAVFISSLLIVGTSITPMQSYADQHKKTDDYKISIKAISEVEKKSASQKLDQDNFCYRGENCQQANEGQQIVGKDNEANGFNDQSKNVQQSVNPTPTPPNLDLVELGDQWWNWAFSIDTTTDGNPFTDTTGALCNLGYQQGNLLFLVGTAGETTDSGGVTGGHTGDVRTCNTPVPRDTSIFFPLLNTECSTLEGNGATVAELRACANGIISNVDVNSLTLIIDGVPSNQLVKRVQSGPDGFQLTVVPNNPFGVDVTQPTTTLSVSDGYWALLPANTLTPGPHTITFGGTANFPDSSSFKTLVTYNIVVI
jgi:hypothetical protein